MVGRLVALVCLLTLAGYSQGVCPGEKMIYYTRTQSCFLFGRDKRQLFGCRYDCEKLRGGQNGDEMGHRARIMDQETDNFLKGYIGGDNFWIDLSDAGKSGLYIWDSSGEKPSYYGWANEGESTKDYERYVVITKNGWKKLYQRSYAYCLCEVDAVIATLTVSTPAPLQVGKKAENAITCSIGGLSWNRLSWYLPTDSEAARCTLQNGNAECEDYLNGNYPATISKDSRGSFTSTLVINEVHRYNEGLWRCNIYSGNNMIGQGSTDVRVYEPAKEIQCNHTLTKTGVEVKCDTARIYPEPKCQWKYEYPDGEYASVAIPINAQRVEKNSKYVENGVHFYKATCILRLEMDTFDFKAGELTLLVAMQPDVTGIDEDTITKLKEHMVKIEKPKPPKFKFNNKTRIGDSLTLVAGEELVMKCFVSNGNPFVYETSVTCDFSFNGNKGNGQGYSETRQSKSVVVTLQANKDMDGRSCNCSGKHITGPTDSKRLVFYVQSPAEISHFQPQKHVHRVQKVYEYRKGTDLDMMCYFSGNPSPSVTMHHVGSTNKLKLTKNSNSISHGMKTACSSNGEYVCEAENTIRGELVQVSKSFSLSITCAPTPCTSVESNKTFGANIGGDANIHLCLYANPAPTKSFWIYALSTGTHLEQDSYNLDYKPQRNAMGELSINLKMEKHMFGAFTVYYSRVKVLKFNIVLKGAPFCPTEVKVTDIGLDYLQLQWTPGTSQEVGESYVIHQLGDVTTNKDGDDDGYTSSQLDDIQANETTVRGIVTYTLTGLEHGTTYNLSVGTRNQHGTRFCLDSWFNATTKEDEVSVSPHTGGSTSASLMIVAIAVPLVVFVVALLIVAIVLWRRKRRQRKLHDCSVATVAINLSGTPEEAREGEEEEEGRVVYASVNKNTQGAKKRGKASGSTNASQSDDAYGDSVQMDHTYRNSAQVCADVSVYNNQVQDSVVYANTADINKSKADGNGSSSSYGTGGGGGAGKKKGGERELVYISVTIDPTKKKVKLNEHGEDGSDKKAKIVEEEEVEYSGLDFTATKLKQKEVEEEERRKKEEEEERRRKEEEEEEGGGGMGGEGVGEG